MVVEAQVSSRLHIVWSGEVARGSGLSQVVNPRFFRRVKEVAYLRVQSSVVRAYFAIHGPCSILGLSFCEVHSDNAKNA
jgi:hypothetical protein